MQKQLFAARHKVTQLKAARDKLEIILHDFEAAASDEQQQLEEQLSAANQALRRCSQQLTAVQGQLADTQQQQVQTARELLDTQQQLTAAHQQLSDARQQEDALRQQAADAAAEVQQLKQQLSAALLAAPAVAGQPAQVGRRLDWLQVQGLMWWGPVPEGVRPSAPPHMCWSCSPCALRLQPGCLQPDWPLGRKPSGCWGPLNAAKPVSLAAGTGYMGSTRVAGGAGSSV